MHVDEWNALTPQDWAQINEELRAQMYRRRLSQTQTANRAGLTRSALTRRLDGKPTWTYNELAKITRIFGMSVDELVRLAQSATHPPDAS